MNNKCCIYKTKKEKKSTKFLFLYKSLSSLESGIMKSCYWHHHKKASQFKDSKDNNYNVWEWVEIWNIIHNLD